MKRGVCVIVGVLAAFAASTAFAEEAAAAAKAASAETAKAATDGANYKPLAEARAKIGDVIADPAKMVEVMKTLSPEDQKAFVADVNAAINKLPGSVEDKTAKFLNVNKAALKGAAKGNIANILAVTFATVPPASLTVLSERYAVDLFNRDADPSYKSNNATYENTAKEVIGKVVQATKGSDDSGVRNTLAILMFVKADNGQTEGLADRLADTLPDSTTRELAKSEWIPAAMAAGEDKSYDAILAYADSTKAPDLNIVLNMAGPQISDAMLTDITSAINNEQGVQTTPIVDQAFGGYDETRVHINDDTTGTAQGNAGATAQPRTLDPTKPWNPNYSRGQAEEAKPVTPEPEPQPEPEPKPYPYSVL